MPNYRVTLGWNHSVFGASETYYTPDVIGPDFDTRLQALIDARNAMLFADCFWTGVRISEFGLTRASHLLLPNTGGSLNPFTNGSVRIPRAGNYLPSPATVTESQFRDCLQVELDFDGTRTTARYISPIPLQLITTEPDAFDGVETTSWKAAFGTLSAELVDNRWCILRENVINPGNYRAVARVIKNDVDNLLGFVLPTGVTAGVAAGGFVHLHNFRPPKGTRLPTVNGRWRVDHVTSVTAPAVDTIWIADTQDLEPSQVRITPLSKIRIVTKGLAAIQHFLLRRVCTHKRGRPFTAPRGRRLIRPSLDP